MKLPLLSTKVDVCLIYSSRSDYLSFFYTFITPYQRHLVGKNNNISIVGPIFTFSLSSTHHKFVCDNPSLGVISSLLIASLGSSTTGALPVP
jgi:hypothetical protein